jgi:hypothetical protein
LDAQPVTAAIADAVALREVAELEVSLAEVGACASPSNAGVLKRLRCGSFNGSSSGS